MYGLVNRAIQDLIETNYGTETWEQVKDKSDIDVDYFISTQPYDDSITYKLAIAVSEVLKISLDEVLFAFGEWWILKTGMEKYGALMQTGGDNLKSFLINLPFFHDRVRLMYPNLKPPEFKISHVNDNDLQLHYYSHREGLNEFVKGLISGLGKMYKNDLTIDHIASKQKVGDPEIFKISW